MENSIRCDAIWRRPAVETEDYPGLVVCDNRVSGSITAGYSRLPLWCLTGELKAGTWEQMEADKAPLYGLTREGFYDFIHHLLDNRGEFARLLCILADLERRTTMRSEKPRTNQDPRWQRKRERERVVKQLQRCLAALGEPAPGHAEVG